MTHNITTLPALDAYRRLAPRYDRDPNPVLALNRRILPGLLPPLFGKTVIDAGAGTGYWAAYCAERAAQAFAFDVCHEMLAYSPAPAAVAGLLQLPLRDECADVAICSIALGYSPHCLPELVRITRPGGVIVASDLHPAAIARGWTRSFQIDGELIAVTHEPYSLESLAHPSLVREALLEPSFSAPEREEFVRAGRPELFDRARGPALFAVRWRRV